MFNRPETKSPAYARLSGNKNKQLSSSLCLLSLIDFVNHYYFYSKGDLPSGNSLL
jgi:hypothetical protein